MFDALSDRLQTALSGLTGHGRISEEDVNVAMREVRMALLEADVNYKVVKDFVKRVKERAMDVPVLFVGVGEKMDDLRDFDPNAFVAALFAVDGESPA